MEFSALVLATTPHAGIAIAGLVARERAARVAKRVGARNVVTLTSTSPAAWREALASIPSGEGVLWLRADELVHTPLVAPMMTALAEQGRSAVSAYVVAPEQPVAPDVVAGAYAGAAFLTPADVGTLRNLIESEAAMPNRETGDAPGLSVARVEERLLAHLQAGAALAVPHGEIARHPLRDRAERRAAHRLLYRILIKTQDNAITKYLYRPVSFPLTVLFSKTPITPNQISYLTGLIVAIGLWFTVKGTMPSAIIGTALVLAASYVDCCDGEIARLKLLSSKFGAWLDTVIDEFSALGYMVALGIHCHLYFGPHWRGSTFSVLGLDMWLALASIGAIGYLLSIYFVYFNIIVVVGSANSQDYVGEFEVIPSDAANAVRLRPAAKQAIAADNLPPVLRWLATYLPYVIRRDFVSWAALAFAFAHLTYISFALQAVGGVVTAVIVGRDHVKLRRQLGEIRRSGKLLQRAA